MKEMKMKVSSPKHSEAIQKRLFDLGYEWKGRLQKYLFTDKPFLITDKEGIIRYLTLIDIKHFDKVEEVTLNDLYNERKPITYDDLSDSAKAQAKVDKEILISACTLELYNEIQNRYFSWLDSEGHYGFYELVVEIVDEMLFTPDSLYLKYMSDPDRSCWADESGTNECFDWYFMNQSLIKLDERMKDWSDGSKEDGNFDFVERIINQYAKYNTIEGESMEALIRGLGQEEQMLKQLIKKASLKQIFNLLSEY